MSISFRSLFVSAAVSVFLLSGGRILLFGEDNPFETESAPETAEAPSSTDTPSPIDTNSPFAGSEDRFRREKNSPALYFKNARGEEIPIIDSNGRVVFRRPEDKPEEEMTEDDFYKTLRPGEKMVVQPEPKTAVELIRASVWISRFGRKAFARLLLEKSFAAEGTGAEFSALIDELGQDKFVRFAIDPEMGPRAEEAYNRVMSEAQKYWESPEVIQQAFERTLKGSDSDRMQAILDLRKGGAAAFETVMNALFSDDSETASMARAILNHLGTYAKEGVLARLADEDSAHLIRLAQTLAEMPDLPDISPLLFRYYDISLTEEVRQALGQAILAQIGEIPAPVQAAERTGRRGEEYFDRKIVLPVTADEAQEIWRWNPKTKKLDLFKISNDAYYRYQASRLLTGAAKLDQTSQERVSKGAVALAEEILYRTGLDNPPDTEQFTAQWGPITPAELVIGIKTAIDTGHPKGGVILAALLAQSGDLDTAMRSDKGEPSVLVQAASSTDRRLRFAALSAIDALNFPLSFPGSGSVVNTLLHFSSASGKRFVVAASAKIANGGMIGSCFSDGTVRVIPVTTGGDIIRSAQENADVEYVIAVSYIRNPDPRTVCQTLAADYRTADIPIYVGIDDETYLEQAQWYAGGEPNAAALPLPSNRETGRWALDQLYQKVKPEQVPADVRLVQAKKAIEMLSRRLGENQSFCEPQVLEKIAVDFLLRPEIRTEALSFALGVRGEKIQRTLADLAGDVRLADPDREAMLTTLDQHIERYGLLIRGPEIRRYYDEYNASETMSKQEQQLRSRRLDILERKPASGADPSK